MTASQILASRIRSLMSQRRLNQKEVARAVHRQQSHVSQVLSGKRDLSFAVVDALARVFDVPVSELFRAEGAARGLDLTGEERELVVGYRVASPRSRQAIRILLGSADAHTAVGSLADASAVTNGRRARAVSAEQSPPLQAASAGLIEAGGLAAPGGRHSIAQRLADLARAIAAQAVQLQAADGADATDARDRSSAK